MCRLCSRPSFATSSLIPYLLSLFPRGFIVPVRLGLISCSSAPVLQCAYPTLHYIHHVVRAAQSSHPCSNALAVTLVSASSPSTVGCASRAAQQRCRLYANRCADRLAGVSPPGCRLEAWETDRPEGTGSRARAGKHPTAETHHVARLDPARLLTHSPSQQLLAC